MICSASRRLAPRHSRRQPPANRDRAAAMGGVSHGRAHANMKTNGCDEATAAAVAGARKIALAIRPADEHAGRQA